MERGFCSKCSKYNENSSCLHECGSICVYMNFIRLVYKEFKIYADSAEWWSPVSMSVDSPPCPPTVALKMSQWSNDFWV